MDTEIFLSLSVARLSLYAYVHEARKELRSSRLRVHDGENQPSNYRPGSRKSAAVYIFLYTEASCDDG